jgi:hypothetical protein
MATEAMVVDVSQDWIQACSVATVTALRIL